MINVRLRIGGVDYGGWTSISVERSMENLAGTFELTVSEVWSTVPGQPVTRPIKPGQSCELLVDGELVLTGFVDDVEKAYDKASRQVTVSGRDKTADLIDCSSGKFASSLLGAGELENVTLIQVATALCAPFGIQVTTDVDVGTPVPFWAVMPGETVFESLEKFARFKGVLLTTDPDGDLLITRASKRLISTPLEHGKNILEVAATFSMKKRGSVYTITSNTIFQGNDQALTATATDAGVLRHRPIVVIAEDMLAPVDWQRRAIWEANVRAARGTSINVTVQGWTHAEGLWTPNCLVTLRDTWVDANGEMLLLTGVRWMLDDKGMRTRLTLTRPEAFDLLPVRLKGLFESTTL